MNSVIRCTMPLLLTLVTAAAIPGCSDGDDEPETPTSEAADAPRVEVVTVETEPLDELRQWSGTLRPLEHYQLRAPHRGTMESMQIATGDSVEAGDLIARLSRPELSARREVLEERHTYLDEEFQRWQQLADAGAAGPGELNDARLRLLEVEQQLAEADAELSQSAVQAPVSGVISDVFAAPRTQVTEGQAIVDIDATDAMGVELSVPSREASFLEQTDRLTIADDRDRRFEVERITYGDSEHRNFVNATLHLDGVDDTRRRHVDIAYEATDEVLLVPWTAVVSEDDRHRVSVVTGDPPRIEERSIELGRAHSAGIEVLSGLDEGERIMRYEPRSQRDGSRIEPTEFDR